MSMPVSQPTRFQQLSAPRQALVRLCQSINFGRIEDLEIRRYEPVLAPAPQVFLDVRLDIEDTARPEQELTDFALPEEICRLMTHLNAISDGKIERIEVRAGLARRLILDADRLEVAR
jgi:hypothetical protein